MAYDRRTVTLNDVVMGKKGLRYTVDEITSFLAHYYIYQASRVTKLALFQQLHELARKRNLSASDRLRAPFVRKPSKPRTWRAVSNTSNIVEGSERLKATELLRMQQVESQTEASRENSECTVCLEKLALNSFPPGRITTGCNHDPTICFDCLTQAIDSQIEDKTWDTLSCPLCPRRLSFETVQKHSSPGSFKRYDRQATMHAMREIPNFRMCLSVDCGSGQVHASDNEQPIMTCNACGFKSCYTHQIPWHEGLTCGAYEQTQRRQNEENEASLALVKRVGKICPKCSVPGIKVSGCDHLTCPRCSYEYCALCLASYTAIKREGNTAHTPECKYHSDKLPANAMQYPGRTARAPQRGPPASQTRPAIVL